MTEISMFFARRDLFFDFLNILMGSERKAGRHIRAKFRTNRASDGLEIVAGEKNKEKK